MVFAKYSNATLYISRIYSSYTTETSETLHTHNPTHAQRHTSIQPLTKILFHFENEWPFMTMWMNMKEFNNVLF
jgi:hypothetical protein